MIALVGDGGFAHSWAELETMVRCRLPVVVIVLNNGVLAYQRDAEQVKFGAYTSACHFAPVDHRAISEACGCRAVRIDGPADIANALSAALSSGEPRLVEIMTDPEARPALSLFDGALDKAPDA